MNVNNCNEICALLEDLRISVRLIMREIREQLLHMVKEVTMEDNKPLQCIEQKDLLKNLAIEVEERNDQIEDNNLEIPVTTNHVLKTEDIKDEFKEISTSTKALCAEDVIEAEEEELSLKEATLEDNKTLQCMKPKNLFKNFAIEVEERNDQIENNNLEIPVTQEVLKVIKDEFKEISTSTKALCAEDVIEAEEKKRSLKEVAMEDNKQLQSTKQDLIKQFKNLAIEVKEQNDEIEDNNLVTPVTKQEVSKAEIMKVRFKELSTNTKPECVQNIINLDVEEEEISLKVVAMEDNKQLQCIGQKDLFKNLAIEVEEQNDKIEDNNLVTPITKQQVLKAEVVKDEIKELSTNTKPECIEDVIDIEAEEEELSFGISVGSIFRKISGSFNLFKTISFLPDYLPCSEIQKAHQQKFTRDALAKTNENFCEFLQTADLNPDNIHIIYKKLLEMEDMTIFSEYKSLAQTVFINHNGNSVQLRDVGCAEDILTPHMDEIVIKIKAKTMSTLEIEKNSDNIFWSYEDRNHISTTITTVVKNCVSFHLNGRKRNLVSSMYTDVAFRPLRIPIRYQHHALELLKFNPDIRNYLFPCSDMVEDLNNNKPCISLVNANIAKNPEQLQAVENIVTGAIQNAPYIIFGPPGTGKTTTLVEAILQLRLHNTASRILVTAGSNSACDTIALRICKYFNSNKNCKPDQCNIIRVFSKSVQQKGLDKIPTILLQNSNCSRGAQVYPAVEDLRRYGIIVATLCTVGKLVSGNIGADFFTHIFIDEAGASTEPETLIGIVGIKSRKCHVILSGDHRQLGPVLKSHQAKELGLEQSMMERLLQRECYAIDENGNYNRTLQTRLRRNYRSHSEIVRLYNHLYYNNELIAQAKNANANVFSNWEILKNPTFPIIFQAVHGQTLREEDSSSTYNELEIEVLLWYLRRMLIDGINGHRVIKQSDIGIITPYKAQCRHIQTQLSARNWNCIEVGTVETYQGREKTIIIGSLVRSFNKLGFSCERRRLNVLLSRAKSLLILIGNPLTLNRCEDFKYIIDECESKGTVRRKKKSNDASNETSCTNNELVENVENNQNVLNIKPNQSIYD